MNQDTWLYSDLIKKFCERETALKNLEKVARVRVARRSPIRIGRLTLTWSYSCESIEWHDEDFHDRIHALHDWDSSSIVSTIWGTTVLPRPRLCLRYVRRVQALLRWYDDRLAGLTRHLDEVRRQQGKWSAMLDAEVAMAAMERDAKKQKGE